MEDKDKKKNVKKIIVYAVLLVLIMGIALGTGQIQTEELGRIFTVNAITVCKLLLLIFGVLFLKSLIVWILGLIKPDYNVPLELHLMAGWEKTEEKGN